MYLFWNERSFTYIPSDKETQDFNAQRQEKIRKRFFMATRRDSNAPHTKKQNEKTGDSL
jgi:hypothetical protein